MRKFVAVALSVGVMAMGVLSRPVASAPAQLTFTLRTLAVLGDDAPNGGEFVFDFEPYAITNGGEVGFGADLLMDGEEIGEGIFILTQQGDLVEVVRAGDPTPEGGTTFGRVFSERTPLNEQGELAFIFQREPVPELSGVNSGVYRFTRHPERVTPVMLPGDAAPGGGEFAGAFSSASLNNRGAIAFSGIVTNADIDPDTPPGIDGLGVGVFVAERDGDFASVVRPGDPAPGGGRFDYADNPSINDRGDVAFAAHVGGEACVLGDQFPLFCPGSVYLKRRHEEVQLVAHQGDPAPGGGTYRFAWRPVLNQKGKVAFLGDLTPAPEVAENVAVFLFTSRKVWAVARPGDALPGGGVLVSAGLSAGTLDLNQRGEVTFSARLVREGREETGVYLWSRGTLHLVAKSGTEIPGLGTIVQLQPPTLVGEISSPWSGGAVNDRCQVVFMAAVDTGSGGPLLGVLLLADPTTKH